MCSIKCFIKTQLHFAFRVDHSILQQRRTDIPDINLLLTAVSSLISHNNVNGFIILQGFCQNDIDISICISGTLTNNFALFIFNFNFGPGFIAVHANVTIINHFSINRWCSHIPHCDDLACIIPSTVSHCNFD